MAGIRPLYDVQSPINAARGALSDAGSTMRAMTKDTAGERPGPTAGGAVMAGVGGAAAGMAVGAAASATAASIAAGVAAGTIAAGSATASMGTALAAAGPWGWAAGAVLAVGSYFLS